MIRTYTQLLRLPTIQERFEYLKLKGEIGQATFGFDRYLNQAFYSSKEWKKVRRDVIVRDEGWDLGVEGYPCGNRPTIHHINPITIEQVESADPVIFDLDNLILCSYDTHNAIHFGAVRKRYETPVQRRPNDTCPWK